MRSNVESKLDLPNNCKMLDDNEVEYVGGSKVPTWGWVIICIGSALIIGASAYGIRKYRQGYVVEAGMKGVSGKNVKEVVAGYAYIGRGKALQRVLDKWDVVYFGINTHSGKSYGAVGFIPMSPK